MMLLIEIILNVEVNEIKIKIYQTKNILIDQTIFKKYNK